MLALATTADAQWNTNAWPPQNHPNSVKGPILCAYSAAVERCSGAGASTPSAPSWMRSTRGNLKEIKVHLRAVVTNYLIKDYADGDGHYHDFLQTNWILNLPHWGVTQLCASVGLPTNYFDYTPTRDLSGVGGHTNPPDPYLYPYGFTNADTARGGSAYPGSRTNWYTTDYGIEGISNLVAKLLWTEAVMSTKTTNGETLGGVFNSNSWANAQAGVEFDFTNDTPHQHTGPAIAKYSSGLYGGVGIYAAEMDTAASHLLATNMSSSFFHTVDIYHRATAADQGGDGTWQTNSYNVFDDHGDADINTNANLTASYTNGNYVATPGYGMGDATWQLPNWCAEPSNSVPEQFRGYRVWSVGVVKWNGTSGFLYK